MNTRFRSTKRLDGGKESGRDELKQTIKWKTCFELESYIERFSGKIRNMGYKLECGRTGGL